MFLTYISGDIAQMAKTKTQSMALPSIVDLDSLDSVRDRMIEVLDGGAVDIDASEVERIATNGLVMLLSAAETARRNNFALSVSTPSEAMMSAIARLGFADSFAPLIKG